MAHFGGHKIETVGFMSHSQRSLEIVDNLPLQITVKIWNHWACKFHDIAQPNLHCSFAILHSLLRARFKSVRFARTVENYVFTPYLERKIRLLNAKSTSNKFSLLVSIYYPMIGWENFTTNEQFLHSRSQSTYFIMILWEKNVEKFGGSVIVIASVLTLENGFIWYSAVSNLLAPFWILCFVLGTDCCREELGDR